MTECSRRGVPMVVSAPSGGGKTTLCRRLISSVEGVEFSISHTTRAPRGKEKSGVDYHFVDATTFETLIRQGAFLEWAEVHGNRYGTSMDEAASKLAAGKDVLFDIDVQGGRQIAERLADAVLVFVLPPDMNTLQERLRGRGSDADEVIARRMAAARAEIEEAKFYTYWIVNDDLDTALDELRAILLAERLRRCDQEALVRPLLGEA